MRYFSIIFLAFLAALAIAHPGHDHKREAEERRDFLKHARSLSHCAEKLKTRGVQQRSLQRRQVLAASLRAKRGLADRPYLKARDTPTVLATSHLSNLTGITLDTPESQLFADNSSCVLQPDVTEGPYYVAGELIRQDVTDGQSGVPLTIDVQVVDTTTCDPLPNLYMDYWHCNATGVYGGVVANGNGDTNDTSNLNNTALRGIQQTDDDGVASFTSVFPGHYVGRTNHIHILTHTVNGTDVLPNNTLTGLTASHVGQIFFDQDLISQVEATTPYSTNTQAVTTNEEDMILSTEADSSDPIMEYVLLGDTVSDGLLGWITVGIDPTESNTVSAAANYYAGGGVENSNGGGFPGGPSGTAPSGFPTGTSAAKRA
ncbi:MAG: hypothetical protein Q9227_001834 [Pyrenula ochraceoflavens]